MLLLMPTNLYKVLSFTLLEGISNGVNRHQKQHKLTALQLSGCHTDLSRSLIYCPAEMKEIKEIINVHTEIHRVPSSWIVKP